MSRGIRRKKIYIYKNRKPGNTHTRVPGVQKKRFLLLVEPLSGRKKNIYIKEKKPRKHAYACPGGAKKDAVEPLSVVVAMVVAMTWHCRCGVVGVGV